MDDFPGGIFGVTTRYNVVKWSGDLSWMILDRLLSCVVALYK